MNRYILLSVLLPVLFFPSAGVVYAFQCFGIDPNDPNVCSGHGVCMEQDICSCQTGYYGIDCSNCQCFGIDRNDPHVCSGHGICVGLDTCLCEVGWLGTDCSIAEYFDCFGIDPNDLNVCSGHGLCIAWDTCQCSRSWTGNMCQQCYYILKADFNKDCIVDFSDFAELVSVWLVDCITDPNNIECLSPQ